MEILVTCNPGLEEVSVKECEELVGREFLLVRKGLIHGSVREKDIFALNYLGKTIHKVILLIDYGEFSDLNDLYRKTRAIDYTQYFLPEQRFAVRTKRFGTHEFTSMDVSRVVGQAIVDSYLESKSIRVRANLKNPDIRFLVEVRDDWYYFGIDTTGNSLHNRWYRKYTHITALKSTIAHSMVMVSGLKKESFIDPMCGVGMIPIEAYHHLSKTPNKHRRFMFENFFWLDVDEFHDFKQRHIEQEVCADIYGSDINPKVISYAKKNAKIAGAEVEFFVSDARTYRFEHDVVCVDLPYGIRLKKVNLKNLYSRFFENLYDCGFSTLVFITAERNRRHVPEYVIPEKEFRVDYDDLDVIIWLVNG